MSMPTWYMSIYFHPLVAVQILAEEGVLRTRFQGQSAIMDRGRRGEYRPL
jgi:hypothetical protein